LCFCGHKTTPRKKSVGQRFAFCLVFSEKHIKPMQSSCMYYMTLSSPPQSVRASENWLKDILRASKLAIADQIVARTSQDSLCVLCKGSRFLCGKTRCPIMVKVNYFLKNVPLMSEDI